MTDEVTPGPGPWAADLEQFPEDQRDAIDAYLREKWQPRVTELEGRAAPEGFDPKLYEQSTQLWTDLENDPESAILRIGAAIYGEEAVEHFTGALEASLGLTPEEARAEAAAQLSEDPSVQGGTPTTPALTPEQQALLDSVQYEREVKQYNEAMVSIKAEHEDLFDGLDAEQVGDILAPHLTATNGDPDKAVERYRKEYERIAGKFQITPPEEVPDEAPPVPAPSAGGQTPVEKDYEGDLGAAVGDFAREMAAKKAPPPVGSV